MAQLVVVSAPSGGGKGTLIPLARRRLPQLGMTISHTTRRPRPGEVHGKEYFFVESRDEFHRLNMRNTFAESAPVHGNLYGTSHAEIERVLGEDKDVLLEIDVQGALQIRQKYPDAHLIFIMPPDRATLEARLRARATESKEDLEIRLAAVPHEMDIGEQCFDYHVVNDVLEKAVDDLVEVIGKCIAPRQEVAS